jgi:4-amino-4-deoxy-L-arabinose transferase-like glycosyltransferase
LFEAYSIALVLVVLAGVFVWRDAADRGDENAALWGLGTALILIVVLPLYLYHRAYGTESLQAPVRSPREISYHDHQEARSTVKCPRCREPTIERVNAYYCEKCDRFVDKQNMGVSEKKVLASLCQRA